MYPKSLVLLVLDTDLLAPMNGRVMFSSDEHPANEKASIDVTLSGIVTLIRFSQLNS